MKKAFLFILLYSVITVSFAQTQHQASGWAALFSTIKFNNKWGLHLDAQVRSGGNFDYTKNFLFRPGLTYYINKNNNVTVGYLLNQTYFKGEPIQVPGAAPFKNPLNEHRIWEQYILSHKISSVFASHRFRLEQRFIENNGIDDVFAQRFRYFFRFIQPLKKYEGSFDKGMFIALQNELFFNVQNKSKINNSLFDQNRAYLAAGYRFTKKVDIEAGYLNQAQHGASNNTINNVIQLALYTRF